MSYYQQPLSFSQEFNADGQSNLRESSKYDLSSDNLRLQPEKSSFSAYRAKYNLIAAGEQALMDGVPRYSYNFNNANDSQAIATKATGKIGQFYYDGLSQQTAEEQIEKELQNCLYNIKKKLRRNEAKAKGFDILEKEHYDRLNNELYDNVVFDDIFDTPNQNYRQVFYVPELNTQEIIDNNTGEELDYDKEIDEFRQFTNETNSQIVSRTKKQGILDSLNQKILETREAEEQENRERIYQEMLLRKNKEGAKGIMKKRGVQRKSKKTLQFHDSVVYNGNSDDDKTLNSSKEYSDNDDIRPLSQDGKVKMSFDDFMQAHSKQLTPQSVGGTTQQNSALSQRISADISDLTDLSQQKKSRWRLQSEAVRAAMKPTSGLTREENQMIVQALNKEGLVYCEFCKRSYKPSVADTHIPMCKEKFEEKQRQFLNQQRKKKIRIVKM